MVIFNQTLGAPDTHGSVKDTWNPGIDLITISDPFDDDASNYKLYWNGDEFELSNVFEGGTKYFFEVKNESNLDKFQITQNKTTGETLVIVCHTEITVLDTNTIVIEYNAPSKENKKKALVRFDKNFAVEITADLESGLVETVVIV